MMAEQYASHRVSVKVAVYSNDKSRVLVLKYDHGRFGLPGGHLEADETPDEALVREFREELGADLPPAKRTDFFMVGRLVLGFVTIAPIDMPMDPPDPDKEHGVWMTRSEFDKIYDIAEAYRKLVVQNWPQ